MAWKKFWCKVDPWLDRDKYAVTTFAVIGALMMLYAEFSKETIRSNKDLITLNATLADYSFKDATGGRHYYYMRFKEYRARFKIPADYLGFFEKVSFKAKTRHGDRLQVTIARTSLSRVQKDKETIFLRGLRSSSETFLHSYSVLEKERGYGMIIFSGCLLVAGIFFYVFRKRYLRRQN